MTSWYSQLLTTTTTRITHLQRTLLAGESDGDTEDDTHVCRVLRNYYTEKGRPFPAWLPPDPKAPPPPAPVYTQTTTQVGSRYGGLVANQQPGVGPGGAAGLSSLWDNNPVGGSGRQDPQSLRQGRGAPPPMRGAETSSSPAGARNPFSRSGGSDQAREDVQARPLPSQRAGSYQQAGLYSGGGSGGGSAAGGGSAQDRLKQRLWGGGSRTTSPGSSTGSAYQPPPAQQQQQQSRYGGGGGGAGGGYGSGGGSGDNYEDRFAPGGMYDASAGYGSRGGGGGGSDRPFVAANAPWATNESDYSGGGGGGSRAGGLPGGPRRGGLPSGPRKR